MVYMFFGDFPKNPLYFGFNFAQPETLFLHTFEFQEPFGHQTDSIFLVHNFCKQIDQIIRGCQHELPQGGNRHAPYVPTLWPYGGTHLPTRGPFYSFLNLYDFVLS
jgi:hypothetical protein